MYPLHVEVLGRRAHDLRANAQNGRLARRAHPQVPPLLQKVHAVFLERDGVRVGLRHALHHLHVFHVQLVAARRALVGTHLSRSQSRSIPGSGVSASQTPPATRFSRAPRPGSIPSRRERWETPASRSRAGCRAIPGESRIAPHAGRSRQWWQRVRRAGRFRRGGSGFFRHCSSFTLKLHRRMQGTF